MIDLHFHCLPGIDDGPRDWEEAVALCTMAAEEGTTRIAATPHVLRDPWINDDSSRRGVLIDELNARLSGTPEIVAGCEVYYSNELVALIEEGVRSPVTALGGGSYILMEFPIREVPRTAESVVYELSLLGVTPIVAHPERNPELAADPKRVEALMDRGALLQITAASYLGEFGTKAKDAACRMTDAGAAFVVASDAHSIDRRPPRLRAAREFVEARWGTALAVALFESNPALVLGHVSAAAPGTLRVAE